MKTETKVIIGVIAITGFFLILRNKKNEPQKVIL